MIAELFFIVKSPWYENGMICLLMSGKKDIRFPVEVNTKLRNATDLQRNNIEIICNGTGLHGPDLDEDLSISDIIEGRYGY